MLNSMSLSILGLIFIIAIAIIYFKKKKYNSIENLLYRGLLVLNIFLLILEICCVYTISIRSQIPVINEIFCRIFIFGTIVWILILICYVKILIEPDKYLSIKDLLADKEMFLYIVVSLLLFYSSCFLNITYTSGVNDQFFVIGGAAVSVLYVIFTIIGISLGKMLISGVNQTNFIKRIPIVMLIALFLTLGIIQILYADFNELTFLFAFCTIAMYFTFENQDIRLVEELDAAKKEAELADKTKTQFLTKISHEIRTPMNVIMGYSEVLINKNKITEKEVKADVKNIYNAGKSLLEIINNILTYSRIEAKKEKIEEVEYSISDIIGELESFVNAKIDPKKIVFSIALDGDIPSNYVGDKVKIYRVLLNLINNAIRYTDTGEITLTIRCNNITENITQLNFEVKDTGIGMTKENLENIFSELNKVNDNDSDISGIGLGLVLTKKIINMLDGKILCESEYGIGTTFNVIINQKVVGTTKIKDLKHLKDKINETKDIYFDCSKYRVLLVDDNKLNRIVIERLLKPYKIKYDSVGSSAECISKIKSGEKYDLILLDHMMPEVDGIETFRILKKMNSITLPPVVAITANIVTELKETYIKEGFSDYLSKPVDIKELNQLIHKYFKRKTKR